MADDPAAINVAEAEYLNQKAKKKGGAKGGAKEGGFFWNKKKSEEANNGSGVQNKSPKKKDLDSQENTITSQLAERFGMAVDSKSLIGQQNLFAFQPDRSKQVQDVKDLTQVDSSGRTVLHRAALEQNFTLVRDLCEYAHEKNLGVHFINQQDRFGNTALILCCVLDVFGSQQNRFKTVVPLIERGAEINVKNPRTLWMPITWCCYYGDTDSVQRLLDMGAKSYLPDSAGRYLLDWAGRRGHNDIVNILVKHLVKIIEDFDSNLDKPHIIRDKYLDDWKYMRTPLLRSNILYWSCSYSVDIEIIKKILTFLDTIPEFPISIVADRTPIHACCKAGNVEALKLLLDEAGRVHEKRYLDYRGSLRGVRGATIISPVTNLLPLTKQEKKLYRPSFLKTKKELTKWLSNYYSKCQKYAITDQNKLRFFDNKDKYGNTPLHITAFLGQAACAKVLIEQGADPEQENKEGWRCIELRRYEKINEIFAEYLKKKHAEQLSKAMAKKVALTLLQGVLEAPNKGNTIMPEPKKDDVNISQLEDPGLVMLKKVNSQFSHEISQIEKKRLIPDIVISFKINSNDPKRNEFLMNRMNFYIQILTQTSFDVYLAGGVSKGNYVLMLKMEEAVLEKECSQLGMKIKLLESYEQEPFDISRRTEFEPFRSLERQEICINLLKRFVDLDLLKSQKVITEYYRMHTMSGINRICRIWISQPRWYWPEPLCSIHEYTLEGRDHNYTAVTILKQYFGEKISFFFAFCSFLSAYMFYLGLPGIGIYIFLLWRRYDDNTTDETMYNHPIVAAWVIYVILWNVYTVERWKRKNAEIATRWGIHNIDPTFQHGYKRVRKEFCGDECISHNIGLLTKKYKVPITVITFLLSIPVLIVLLAAVVGSFIGTTYLKDYAKTYDNGNYSTGIQFAAGVLNGISISILNTIYTLIARWFVNKENHKFQETYERSLIIKTFLFRFLNSLIGVFYVAFFETTNGNYSDLQEVFILLLTLVFTKQATSIVTLTVLPFVIYKLKQRKYFKDARLRATVQNSMNINRNDEPNVASTIILDEDKKTFWKKFCRRSKKKREKIFSRPVLDCKRGVTQDYWELSQVEMNGIRNSFKDLVDSYGETFILLSFITLFAAAFPIGPAIALFCLGFDIRSKLVALVYVYDRPAAEQHDGIGYWLHIWELITIASVFTNLILLYRHLDYNWDDVTILGQQGDFAKLFIFIICEHGILLLKYFLSDLIPDVPKWVIKRQLRLEYQEDTEIKHLKESHKKALKTIEASESYSNKGKLIEKITNLQENLDLARDQISRLIAEKQGGASNSNNSLNSAIKLVLYDVFATIERELLIQRVSDINDLNVDNLAVRCTICSLKKAVIEYKSTQEYVCRKCFFTVQSKLNFADKQVEVLPFSKPQESDVGLKEELAKLRKNNANAADTTSDHNSSKAIEDCPWKKFEYYSFPINVQSDQYEHLGDAFKLLQQIYINTNGISSANQVVDEQKFLRIKKSESSVTNPSPDKKSGKQTINQNNITMTPMQKSVFKTELRLENYESYMKFVQLTNFNIEEKFFMNKVAFLIFKRNGAQAKFQEFFRVIKSLQDGTFENKVYVLFDLLDENDDGNINRDDLLRVIRGSYLQSSTGKEEVRQVVTNAFKDQNLLDKKTAFPKILNDPSLKSLLICLLQVRS